MSSIAPMKRWLVLPFAALLLVPGTSASAQPRVRGDTDERIAFQRVMFGKGTIAIFTIRPDGTGVRQITFPAPGIETARPDWSPDGRRIAYMRATFPWDESVPRHLFVIWADGSHRRDLTARSCRGPCASEEDPVWSPDGRFLAYTRVGRVASISVMRVNGTHRRPITRPRSTRFADSAPTWSPDGRRLVFTRTDAERERTSVFVVRSDGSGLRRITGWSGDQLVRPDWSPDGRWILLPRTVGGRVQLSLIHPDGTGARAITHTPNIDWAWACFSPDGTMIAAVGEPGETSQNDVYVMNLDGRRIRPVTESLSTLPAEGLPDWGTAPVGQVHVRDIPR